MSSSGARKAWIVATSIGAVEALKDQLGFCRWNYPLRSLHQQAKSKLISASHTPRYVSSSDSSAISSTIVNKERTVKRTEESLKKVMDLSCWGPTTVRF